MTAQAKALKNHKSHVWRYDNYIRPDARPKFSFGNPNPSIGYGKILLEYYKVNAPLSRKNMQIRLGKKPTSSSGTYWNLAIAGLISVTHKGYIITSLGKQYVEEMLSDYI